MKRGHRHPYKNAPSATAAWDAASFLPDTFLEGGETVLLIVKPSPLSILLGGLPQLAVIGGLFAFSDKLMPTVAQSDRALGALGLGGIILTWHLLDWLGKTFVLTDRRVVRISGVFRPGQARELRLRDIARIEPRRHLFQQLCGLASLRLDPADARPTAHLGALEWEDLAHPQDVAHAVDEAVKRYGR